VDCTPESLSKLRPTRNEKIITPEEELSKDIVPCAIDAFAFGVLAEMVVDGLSDGTFIFPFIGERNKFCFSGTAEKVH